MRRHPGLQAMLCVAIVLVATTSALASSPKDAETDGKLLSGGVVDILQKGGPVMILILVGSIVAIAFAFERAVTLLALEKNVASQFVWDFTVEKLICMRMYGG